MLAMAALVAAALLAVLASGSGRARLGEWVQGSPLDAVFRMVLGDLRGRMRDSAPVCSPTVRASRPTPVILIAIDTIRADRLGFLGYERDVSPRIDELARESIVYRRAISAAPWTTPAFVGIFTGSHPGALGFEGEALVLPGDVPVLADALCEAGWQTAGVVSHSYVGIKYGFDRGFEHWDERNAGGHLHVSSESITSLALDFVDEVTDGTPGDSERPLFLFAHYFDPHYDYREHATHRFSSGYSGPHQSQNDNFNQLVKLAYDGELDAAAIQHLHDSYDSEIAYTDAEIGRLIDGLKERGLYDESLIVLLGDHGEMLVERPERLLGHGMAVYQPLVHVPLLIKLPGSERVERVDGPVSTVDVMPTILDFVGHPERASGEAARRSLLRLDQANRRPAFAQTRRDGIRDTVVDGNWKLIRDTVRNRSELYDLDRDETESNDVAWRYPEVVARLEARLESWHEELARHREGRPDAAAPELSEEEIEQLRGLGYVE